MISSASISNNDDRKIDENPKNYNSGTTDSDSEIFNSSKVTSKRVKRQNDGGTPDEDVPIFTSDDNVAMTTTVSKLNCRQIIQFFFSLTNFISYFLD